MLHKIIPIILILSSAQAFSNTDCYDRWEKLFDEGKVQLNDYQLLGMCDYELRGVLNQLATKGHNAKSYSNAVKFMYNDLDLDNGKLCSVYTPSECNVKGEAKEYRINCEHTWPKSLGAKEYPMVSDLHHLYPSEKDINNLRGNLPFCEISYAELEKDGSKYGVGNGSETCFEPQDKHKGNVARSMFYFAVRYGLFIDQDQEKLLRKWNELDPVNSKDLTRNKKIKEFQGNSNPFVERSYLVDLISDF